MGGDLSAEMRARLVPNLLDLRVKRVRVSRVNLGARVSVQVVVTSSQVLGLDDIDRFKERIRQWTGRGVELEAEFHLRR